MGSKTEADPALPPQLRRRFDVIFVLPHMGRGGAQRVISLVANAWSGQGKRICVLTWDGNRMVEHEIAPDVTHIDLKEFCRALNLRSGYSRRLWRQFADRMRKLERWLRPRWPWRRKKFAAVPKGENGSSDAKQRKSLSSRLMQPAHRVSIAILKKFEWPDLNINFRWLERYAKRSLALLLLGHRVEMFRRALTDLDAPVVMSLLTGTNLYVLGAARNLNSRIIVSERNDPDLQEVAPEWRALRQVLYRDADAVTSNSAGVLEKLSAFVPAEKLKLLPNPVSVPIVLENGRQRERRFVTVTRLVHQKGVDLLLKAFSQIAHELPDWTLHIVGDGPLRPNLIAQAERLGVAKRVTFHGHVKTPVEILRTCRVFVLSSRFEGMPNALLEAMACGLAPIVTDASPGPLECVRPNRTGLVAETENASAIAAAMLDLARDDDLAVRLGRQAANYVKVHDWAVVERQWLSVLGMAAGEAGEQPMQGTELSYA